MNHDQLTREKAEVERLHGPWTAHNLRLAAGVHTISTEPTGDESKLARVLQIVADVASLSGRSIADLRILDLATLEGMYAIELAARGATVLAIEGRDANLAKARFAARALGVDSVDFELGDVRSLSPERHGTFDIVLCLGILYHLDTPDVFTFLEQIGSVCRTATVFDTWIARTSDERRQHRGQEYRGASLFEHDPGDAEAVRNARVWSSLDNPRAFIATRPSLLRLLGSVGFTSVFECHLPSEGEKPPDRVSLLALKGRPEHPVTVDAPPPCYPPEPATSQAALGRRALSEVRAALTRALGRHRHRR